MRYTKHYYANGQRVQSKIGTAEHLGPYQSSWFNNDIPELQLQDIRNKTQQRLNAADGKLQSHYNDFFEIGPPTIESAMGHKGLGFNHNPDLYAAYWFHLDHTSTPLSTGLGSSNYITNLDGNVSQHMEYMPGCIRRVRNEREECTG